MTTIKQCPTCGTKHAVEMTHSWDQVGSRRELSFIQRIDSINLDGVKLESLMPIGPDDGQELAIEGKWLADGNAVHFRIFRRPRAAVVQALQTPPDAAPRKPMTRADMDTRCAELNIRVEPKWKDVQVAKLITDKEAELAAMMAKVNTQ